MPKHTFFGLDTTSSVDVNELALTVKGLILGASSGIIFLASLKGITILPTDVQTFALNISTMVSGAGIVISSIATTYGLLRKVIVHPITN